MELIPTPATVQGALDLAAKSPWHLAHPVMWPSTPEGRELETLRKEVAELKAKLAEREPEE
jgi:hypothetical protein